MSLLRKKRVRIFRAEKCSPLCVTIEAFTVWYCSKNWPATRMDLAAEPQNYFKKSMSYYIWTLLCSNVDSFVRQQKYELMFYLKQRSAFYFTAVSINVPLILGQVFCGLVRMMLFLWNIKSISEQKFTLYMKGVGA